MKIGITHKFGSKGLVIYNKNRKERIQKEKLIKERIMILMNVSRRFSNIF